jgi:hypothetical protein
MLTAKSSEALADQSITKTVNQKRGLFRDSITIEIPLNVTVDLGAALKRTKAKRLQRLLDAFPHLKQPQAAPKETAKTEAKDTNVGESTAELETPKSKKQKLANVPHPSDFGNMIDYLEAKYVQGVTVEDSNDEDDEEGQGSVYSQNSFFDDADLQRNVAEQVLAKTTTTKMELEDDNEYFVNVGQLEVEESELTKELYDPLDDINEKKPARKRKPSVKKQEATEDAKQQQVLSSPAKKKDMDDSAKKKRGRPFSNAVKQPKLSPSLSPKKKKKPSLSNIAVAHESKSTTTKQDESQEEKAYLDECLETLTTMVHAISSDDLPRRKTKDRVTLTCPPEKKPGDTVTFSNPHVPGQRLQVKIPAKTLVGGTFRVMVPAKDLDLDEDKDYNKWSRDFYDAFEEYCTAYDEWCDAEGICRKRAGDDEYAAHLEKRKKFDALYPIFPKDLKTPIDLEYMKKLLRRARQNKSKRAALLVHQTGTAIVAPGVKKTLGRPPAKKTLTVKLPLRSKIFPETDFCLTDFIHS